jgi:hypothetical protein
MRPTSLSPFPSFLAPSASSFPLFADTNWQYPKELINQD